MKKTIVSAVVLLVLIGVGCKVTMPATQPVKEQMKKTGTAIEQTVQHIEQAQAQLPADTPPVVPVELDKAKQSAKEAQQSNTEAENFMLELLNENDRLRGEASENATRYAKGIEAEKKKTSEEHGKRVEAEEKYKGSWFGGKFWAWVRGISITVGILTVLGLLLNYYTDAFVHLAKPVVWVVVGVIGGAFKAMWQALCWCCSGIVKLWTGKQ